MPELPEVECVVRSLGSKILGATVTDAKVNWPRSLFKLEPERFAAAIAGRRITAVTRRAKFIVIELSAGASLAVGIPARLYLLIHLRMSGYLTVVSKSAPPAKHDRVVIKLTRQRELRFNDVRKFGRLFLIERLEDLDLHLGPEPLSSEFTAPILHAGLRGKSRAIKPLLLDQSFLAGLGNIYVDESLWQAQIHPKTRSNRVSTEKSARLFRAIRAILSAAIRNRGTDFGDGVVRDGGHRPKVYGREGKPCLRCKTSIRKTRIGQRGTHFCPKCQVHK